MLVEGVEQLLVGNDIAVSVVRILREAVEKLQFFTDCTKVHGVLLADSKLLGLYSRYVHVKVPELSYTRLDL